MSHLKRIHIVLFVLITYSSYSQKKYEKEYRINSSQVPKTAQEFIDSLDFKSRIKWYREIRIKDTSVEAKTKFNGKKYSIEFNNSGVLEDAEIEIKWSDLNEKTKNNISNYLTSQYDKYHLDKIQIQYSGTRKSISKKLKSQKFDNQPTVRYELVIHAKIEKQFKAYEYLFSNSGAFLNKAEIILRLTDNLEF